MLIIILLICLLLAALWTVLAGRILMAAIALAVTSVALTAVMYFLGSPLAAVFELSICAGLITVIFISAITFVAPMNDAEYTVRKKQHLKKYIALPFILILIGAVLYMFVKPAGLALPPVSMVTDVRDMIWNFRQTDLLGQSIILLVGVFGIMVLFRSALKK